MKKHIVSFSGGKDSTAMLLKMIEHNMTIDYILFADTGMEFPEMYEHIKLVIEKTGKKIEVLKSDKDYKYLMFEHVKKKGKRQGEKGYMWMDWRSRWCTSELKQKPIRNFYKQLELQGFEIVEYHGIALDESHRTVKNKNNKREIIYPLIDFSMTEEDALNYCYQQGYDWGGLYNKFDRLSCYMCPLQRLSELKVLWMEFPNLWENMRALDYKNIELYGRKFRSDYSIDELDSKFQKEVNDEI